MLDYTYEEAYAAEGYANICGVDEAGRGPLMGPVCAAAVILPRGLVIEGLNDSKKLSEKKREALFTVITGNAVAYGIGFASAEEIDEINILNASMLAMERAIEALSVKADFALIDGNCKRNIKIPAETVVGGDAKVPSISVRASATRTTSPSSSFSSSTTSATPARNCFSTWRASASNVTRQRSNENRTQHPPA